MIGTEDKLYKNLAANSIKAKQSNQIQCTRIMTLVTDKHFSPDSEGEFCSGC